MHAKWTCARAYEGTDEGVEKALGQPGGQNPKNLEWRCREWRSGSD